MCHEQSKTPDFDPVGEKSAFDGKAIPPDRELEILVLRFLDGDELEDISFLLSIKRFGELLALHAVDSANLSEFCSWIELCLPDHEPKQAAQTQKLSALPAADSTPRASGWHAPALGALAAAVAILIAVGIWIWPRHALSPASDPSRPSFALCTIDNIVGDVRVGDEAAVNFEWLGAGQNIRTVGALSSVRLIFADETAIQLAGNTAARVHESAGQKLVYLDYGNAAASVTPQPRGKPLLVHTATAVLEVVGTEFAVVALPESTELSVTEGVVLMKPRSGGEAIPVRDGESSEVTLAKILPPYHVVSAPDSWSVDFDQGLPEGWVQGVWVPDDTPSSGDGAIAAEYHLSAADKERQPTDFYIVQSNDRWANGLVRLREDSELTYRIKMDRPQWYQVFICVRAEPIRDGVWSWNYEYQESASVSWEKVTPGEWREIRIPVSKFKRQEQRDEPPPGNVYEPFELRTGEPPPVDGLVVWVMFTTQNEDRGMVVDDIAIRPARQIERTPESAAP